VSLSVAQRRTIGNQAASDAAFQALLKRDPAEAIKRSTGLDLPRDCVVDVVDEGKEWAFVLLDRATLEDGLPVPTDLRGQVENSAYALLRDDPAAASEIRQDPAIFVRNRLGLDLGSDPIVVHDEAPGGLTLIIPNRDERDGLSDDLLDLVAGGGDRQMAAEQQYESDTGSSWKSP